MYVSVVWNCSRFAYGALWGYLVLFLSLRFLVLQSWCLFLVLQWLVDFSLALVLRLWGSAALALQTPSMQLPRSGSNHDCSSAPKYGEGTD